MGISQETLSKLLDLLEGRVDLGWSKWWLLNSATIEEEFGRADFLKIKFHHCQGIIACLKNRV